MLDTRHRELPRLRRMGGGGGDDDDAMSRPLRVSTAYGGADRFELRRCNSEEGYVSLRDIVGSPEYAAGAAADAMPRPLRVPTAYGGADGFELRRCNSEEGYVSLRDIIGSPEYAAGAAAAASAGRVAIRDPLVKHAACAYLRLVPPHPPHHRRCCGRGRSLVCRFFAALALLFRGHSMNL